jgi:hypothetical protein
MIDKDNELIHDGHECDCEGDDCACGEPEQNIITRDMEDGSQKDFEVAQIINHEGRITSLWLNLEPLNTTYCALKR